LRASLATHGEPDPRALAAGLGILRAADLREALPRITAPTLVIAGEYDRITPAVAGRELASLLPSARFTQVDKAGHAPFLSHPGQVLDLVQSFLAFRTAPAPGITPPAGHDTPDEFALDAGRVRNSFSEAAPTYDAAAVLQKQVREELLGRLEVLRMQPQVVVDLGAGTGHAALALKRRYPGSRVIAMDLAIGMLREAGRRQTLLRRFSRVGADAAAVPLRDESVDMIFSNLMLQWCNDADRVLRECRRVLRPGGVLHFTTLGPDTLVELRRSWQQADPGHAHVSRFIDMHDIGDALVRAGFAEPVLDVERYTLQYDDVRGLMRDLKAIGAHNATEGRPRGLTGKSTLARMLAAYETYRRAGKLPATYEVVFAQAWCPTAPIRRKAREAGAEVLVPLSELGKRT
jgi:malonyl-CoA O-methyltransferase